jgi:hypothetical protein
MYVLYVMQEELTVETICRSMREQVRTIETLPDLQQEDKEAEKLKASPHTCPPSYEHTKYLPASTGVLIPDLIH